MSAVDDIRARAAAATPGPWRWAGNVDNGDPRLVARGRDVLGHVPHERSTADREYRERFRSYLHEVNLPDGFDTDGDGVQRRKWRRPTRAEAHEYVRETWLEDEHGEPRRDDRLAFVNEHLFYDEARSLVVFEVCREATSRDDPRVYRGDIVGIRHPDAEFIAHARADIDTLLAEVDRIEAARAEMKRIVQEWIANDGFQEGADGASEVAMVLFGKDEVDGWVAEAMAPARAAMTEERERG